MGFGVLFDELRFTLRMRIVVDASLTHFAFEQRRNEFVDELLEPTVLGHAQQRLSRMWNGGARRAGRVFIVVIEVREDARTTERVQAFVDGPGIDQISRTESAGEMLVDQVQIPSFRC